MDRKKKEPKKREEKEEEEEEEEEEKNWQIGGLVQTRSQKRQNTTKTELEGDTSRTGVIEPNLSSQSVNTTPSLPFSQAITHREFDWNAPSTSSQVPRVPTEEPEPIQSRVLPSSLHSPSSSTPPTSPRYPTRATNARLNEISQYFNNEEVQEGDDDYIINYNVKKPKIFKGKQAKAYIAKTGNSSIDYQREINHFRSAVIPFAERQLQTDYKHGMKIHISAKSGFDVVKEGTIVDRPTPLFSAKSVPITIGDNVEEQINPLLQQLQNLITDYKDAGSNFQFREMMEFNITVCNYSPQRIGTYIKTPHKIARKRATINIKATSHNDENYCFLDCILAVLYPVKGREKRRANNYRHLRSKLNTVGLEFPIEPKMIPKFESLNPEISVNVYGCDLNAGRGTEPLFFPYKISKNRGKDKKVVNLLLLEEKNRSHFITISNLSRLTRKGNSSSKARKTKACPYCLNHKSLKLFKTHKVACETFTPLTTNLPEPGSTICFKEYGRNMPLPYFGIYDFETYEVPQLSTENQPESPLPNHIPRIYSWICNKTEKTHCEGSETQKKCATCTESNPCQKIRQSTKKCCRLEAFSWAYKIISSDQNEQFPLVLHMQEGATEAFLSNLKKDMITLYERLQVNVPIIMTQAERKAHRNATRCKVCLQR